MRLPPPFSVIQGLWAHPLGARRKLRTLARYLGWQTVGRLRGRRVLRPWVNGAALEVVHGMAGATGNLYVGLHEFEEMAFLLHLLRPDDLFVDVGANVGSYTILACSAVGARVVAFEPVAATHAALLRNVALNAAQDRVDARQVAVSDHPGTVRVTTGADAMNRVVAPEHAGGAGYEEVAAQTLDAALRGMAPLLLKIDVEGHEVQVLRGAAEVLARRELLAVLIEDWGAPLGVDGVATSPATILVRHGFERCAYDPFQRALAPLGDASEGAVAVERRNSIFVRDVQAAQRRLRESPPVRVFGLRF